MITLRHNIEGNSKGHLGTSISCHALGVVLMLLFFCVGSVPAQAQSIIRVPTNHPSIQAAINAAVNGDTVLVAPGVYVENINFNGKGISVESESGANVTAIDGNNANSVVTFANSEGASSRLIGFTIRHGLASNETIGNYYGGGIQIVSASPVIRDNIIVDNRSCAGGHGISIHFGSPVIQRNVIAANKISGCSSIGGAIGIEGIGSAQILGNVIAGNTSSGITLFNAGTTLIKGNIISGNSTVGANSGLDAGGIGMIGESNATIIQNLIVDNIGVSGGGIYDGGQLGPLIVNNTVANNEGQQGSEIYLRGYGVPAQLINNIVAAKANQTALYCGQVFNLPSPIIQFSNIYSPSGAATGGICNNVVGTVGNISASPMFVDPNAGIYRLTTGSQAIDAGSNSAPGLPSLDIEGNARVRDGDGNGVATLDMGAYEFSLTPVSLALSSSENDLGTLFVGSSPVSRTVTISNTGPEPATVVFSALASNDSASFTLTTGGSAPCANLSPTLGPGSSCTLVVTFGPGARGAKTAWVVAMSNAIGSPAATMFRANVVDVDSTPDNFTFDTKFGVARGSTVVSNSVTVTGITVPAAIAIFGGEYSINGGAFTANPGTISNGLSVVVRLLIFP